MARLSPSSEIELTRTMLWLEEAKLLAREDALDHFGRSETHPGALKLGTDPLDVRRYFEDRVRVRFNELKAAGKEAA